MLNKLARTFTAQVEALKQYRASGEQTIKVQSHEPGAATTPSAAHEPSRAMLGHVEAVGLPLPSSGSARQERVPIPRRTGRSAQGEN
jgi:hypothetical protein